MPHSPMTHDEEKRILLRLALRILWIGFLIFISWFVIPPLFSLLAPFVLALITATLLNPTIRLLQKKLGWGRSAFTFLVLLLLLCFFGGALFFLLYMAGKQLIELAGNWAYIFQRTQEMLLSLEQLFDRFWSRVPPALSDTMDALSLSFTNWMQQAVPDILEALASRGGTMASSVPSFLLALLMFVMATYFLAADYPYLRTRAISHMSDDFLRFWAEVRITALSAFGGYLKAQFLLSVGVFFILLAGFFLINQHYGILLALALAALDFIPIIGAGTVMVPWAFLALFSGDHRTAVELFIVWVIVAIFRRVAEPKFVGNQTGLSPILSLISIYVGMRLAGIMGMIFAPIMVLVLLNLIGLGIFRGLQADFYPAIRMITRFFQERPPT